MAGDLPILLLAAGQSRRMRGRDKLMEPIAGQPLLRRTAERALAAGIGPLLVTLPPPPHPRYAALTGLDLSAIAVPEAAEGLSASLRRGIEALPPASPAVMILLADLPDLTANDLRIVAQSFDPTSKNLIWRGASAGIPGHPVILSRALFPELQALVGDTGAQPVLRRHSERMTLVPLPETHALCDLDTPEAWAAWRADHPDA